MPDPEPGNISSPQTAQIDFIIKRSDPVFKRQLHFSVTQLLCYLQSREEYEARYRHRLPIFKEFAWGKPRLLDPVERGEIIHQALCRLTSPHNRLSAAAVIEALLKQHALQTALSAPPFDPAEELQQIIRSVEETLHHENFQTILHPEEGYSEIPFRLFLGDYEIQGAVDRLIRVQGAWRIIDYKTHAAPLAKDYGLQLKTYALAMGKMLRETISSGALYWIKAQRQELFSFSPADLAEQERFLIDLMETINQNVSE